MEAAQLIERRDFDAPLRALADRGYTILGPTVRDGAIMYGEVATSADLPAGWTDEQEAGRYRLRRRGDEALFGFAVGPQSLKQVQLPPALRVWRARLDPGGG